MKKVIFMLLMLVSLMSFAEPSKSDITNAINSGNLTAAEQMINEVVTDHPSSAKAHYFKSQVLAKENKVPEAKIELNVAMTLDPRGSFTDPDHLSHFRAVLDDATLVKNTTTTTTVATTNRQRPSMSPYVEHQSGFSVLLMFLTLFVVVIGIVCLIYQCMSRPTVVVTPSQRSYPSGSGNWGNSSVNTGYPQPAHQMTQQYYASPQPVVVNNGGMNNGNGMINGLVAGMAIESMLDHNHGGYDRGGYGNDNFGSVVEQDTVTTTTTQSTESYSTPSFSFDSGSSDWGSSSGSSDSGSSWGDSSGGSDW